MSERILGERGLAWGRLLRLSLFPTAAADVACGLVLGNGGAPDAAGLGLIAASLCVYHGGMAWNDWADREEDARVRPDRPIPSGAVSARAAFLAGLALLAAGPWIAWGLGSVTVPIYIALALLAGAYDVRLRGPWAGPAMLALCRAGNLYAGVAHGAFVGASPPTPAVWTGIALYGAYVFIVSRLGRLEDRQDSAGERTPSLYLGLSCLLLLAAPVAIFAGSRAPLGLLGIGIGVLGAAAPLRVALGTRAWEPGSIVRAMGMALRRLLVFTAAASAATGGLAGIIVAAAILCGYPASFALRKPFPPS